MCLLEEQRNLNFKVFAAAAAITGSLGRPYFWFIGAGNCWKIQIQRRTVVPIKLWAVWAQQFKTSVAPADLLLYVTKYPARL